jgi:hypothetical protein
MDTVAPNEILVLEKWRTAEVWVREHCNVEKCNSNLKFPLFPCLYIIIHTLNSTLCTRLGYRVEYLQTINLPVSR